MGSLASRGDEQLEHVVERGGVGLTGLDERQELLQVVAEKRRGKRGLAGGEGVEVALEGVDLAVVREGAEGVGERPTREGVRGIALVDEREGRDEVRIREVLVEVLHLRCEEEALVDDRLRGTGADVAVLRLQLDLAADDEELAFEVVLRELGTEEELTDLGHHAAGVVADRVRIDGDVAPGEDLSTLVGDDLFDDVLLADGAEDHRDAVLSGRREVFYNLAEEGIGDSQKKTGAVARSRVVARGAAVHEALEDGESGFDDGARCHVVKIRNESNATGVMFKFRAVQPTLSIFFLVHDNNPFRGCFSKVRAKTDDGGPRGAQNGEMLQKV